MVAASSREQADPFQQAVWRLTQFTSGQGRATLADYLPVCRVYPAGRLDMDSEGLVVLTDDGALQAEIAIRQYR